MCHQFSVTLAQSTTSWALQPPYPVSVHVYWHWPSLKYSPLFRGVVDVDWVLWKSPLWYTTKMFCPSVKDSCQIFLVFVQPLSKSKSKILSQQTPKLNIKVSPLLLLFPKRGRMKDLDQGLTLKSHGPPTIYPARPSIYPSGPSTQSRGPSKASKST